MVKVHGLFRADGRPVRQYGEDILEPGKEFNGGTLDAIRSLVGDGDPERAEPEEPSGSYVARDEPRDPAPLDENETTDTNPTADTPQDEIPAVAVNDAPLLPPEPQGESPSVPAPITDEQTLDEAALIETLRALWKEGASPGVGEDSPNTAIAPTGTTDKDVAISTSLSSNPLSPDVEPERASLPAVKAGSVEPVALPATSATPRGSWRKIEVGEGRPGRFLRRTIFHPRWLGVLFIGAIFVWRPWFIPWLVLSAFLLAILIGITIGSDRVAKIVAWTYWRQHRHAPLRAEKVRTLASRLIARSGRLAEALPPLWAEALFVPDLLPQSSEEEDARLLGRLERIAEEGTAPPSG